MREKNLSCLVEFLSLMLASYKKIVMLSYSFSLVLKWQYVYNRQLRLYQVFLR